MDWFLGGSLRRCPTSVLPVFLVYPFQTTVTNLSETAFSSAARRPDWAAGFRLRVLTHPACTYLSWKPDRTSRFYGYIPKSLLFFASRRPSRASSSAPPIYICPPTDARRPPLRFRISAVAALRFFACPLPPPPPLPGRASLAFLPSAALPCSRCARFGPFLVAASFACLLHGLPLLYSSRAFVYTLVSRHSKRAVPSGRARGHPGWVCPLVSSRANTFTS